MEFHIQHSLILDVVDPPWKTVKDTLYCTCSALATTALEHFSCPAQGLMTELILCDDAHIAVHHQRYLHISGPTNVLALGCFRKVSHITNHPRPCALGTVMMGYETIEAQAQEQHKVFLHHSAHLFLHGFLHLLGCVHETQADAHKMERVEVQCLAQHGFPHPYETGEL